jgi:hypothetical protein
MNYSLSKNKNKVNHSDLLFLKKSHIFSNKNNNKIRTFVIRNRISKNLNNNRQNKNKTKQPIG